MSNLDQIDFKSIARDLLKDSNAFVSDLLPSGKLMGREWTCGDLSGRPGSSCKVNLDTGVWSDFATGEKGGDLISLYAAVKSLSQREAAMVISGDKPPTQSLTQRAKSKSQPRNNIEQVKIIPTVVEEKPKFSKAYEKVHTYHTQDGRPWFYVGRKVFTNKEGKREKLFTPKIFHDGEWKSKAPNPRPLYNLHLIKDAAQVLICEGEKAADAANKLHPAIKATTIMGGSNGVKKANLKPLYNKRILIWPDNDAAGIKYKDDLVEALDGKAKEIKYLDVSSLGPKEDAADFAQKNINFEAWVEKNIISTKPQSCIKKLPLPKYEYPFKKHTHYTGNKNYLDLAKDFLNETYPNGFIYVNDECYGYEGKAYIKLSKSKIKSKISSFLENNLIASVREKITSNFIKEVLEAVQNLTYFDIKNQNTWLTQRSKNQLPNPKDLVVLKNCIYDVRTSLVYAHTSNLFTTTCTNYDYDPNATCPIFNSFLDSIFPGDTQSQQVVLEVIGLMLVDDISFQTMFLFIGVKRSGKGVLLHLIRLLIGEKLVTSPSLHQMDQRFALESFIEKRAAFFSDARLGKGRQAKAIIENLLRISAGDSISVERKNKKDWIGVLKTKIILVTNETIDFQDSSGVLMSRFITLYFKESFYGKEDKNLISKLQTELSGILNRAVKALQTLRERGRFLQPESGSVPLKSMQRASSPFATIINENFIFSDEYSIKCEDFFCIVNDKLADNGIKEMTPQAIGKKLQNSGFFGLRKEQRRINGKPVRFYIGVKANNCHRV